MAKLETDEIKNLTVAEIKVELSKRGCTIQKGLLKKDLVKCLIEAIEDEEMETGLEGKGHSIAEMNQSGGNFIYFLKVEVL